MYESPQADYVVFREIEQLREFNDPEKVKGFYKRIESNNDLDQILKAAEAGAGMLEEGAAGVIYVHFSTPPHIFNPYTRTR